jgi:uncharacterized RDD family membrane protein YckC
VTKTCLQCGAVLPSSIRACNFCEVASVAEPVHAGPARALRGASSSSLNSENDFAWRDELAHRLETYRGRKKKMTPNAAQTRLPFEGTSASIIGSPAYVPRENSGSVPAAIAIPGPDRSLPLKEEFSFTIAIGRPPKKRDDDTRMIIDVSLPPEKTAAPNDAIRQPIVGIGRDLFPTASIDERRLAAVIDSACLLFAYGAFLALFGALGGDFTVSKLSGEVCIATFAIVYLQYFALFTIFGGTTPGMMLRGLRVVSLTGEPPTPRQMLLRSAGYVLSAGTFFLGFVWSMWDEDALTWHDRISRTYLSSAESYTDVEAAEAAPIH